MNEQIFLKRSKYADDNKKTQKSIPKRINIADRLPKNSRKSFVGLQPQKDKQTKEQYSFLLNPEMMIDFDLKSVLFVIASISCSQIPSVRLAQTHLNLSF